MNLKAGVRPFLGVLFKDLPRYVSALSGSGSGYLAICNRGERLESAPDGSGYRCLWKWTSDLHAPKFLPGLALRLMRRALADHPIVRASAPARPAGAPEVSFIIGHRGMDRLPQLLATLESIAGQEYAAVECLVVEQDTQARISRQLPAWVRHVHTPPPSPDMPYCRSLAFNMGVKHASGTVLVLHDNDMLVPSDYCANILKHVRNGFEVINLMRFIFYLSKEHTQRLFAGRAGLTDDVPLAVVQNLEGGGSVAVTRKAFDLIGGLDESFVGWGGEDNEFWERAQTRRVWSYTCLPVVHLWHAPQSQKADPDNPNKERYLFLSKIPPEQRIAALTRRNSGDTARWPVDRSGP